MMCAGAALASSALVSQTALSIATVDIEGLQPIEVRVNGVSWQAFIKTDSLSIDDTLGEQTTCQFLVLNPATAPAVGHLVEVWYFAECLFSGTINTIKRTVDLAHGVFSYDCTCTDWSQVLMRHILRRNFIQFSLQEVCDSLLENELAGEGLTFGTSDKNTSIPLIDSQSSRIFDVLRDAAGVTGQTFYIDYLKRIQFRATTNEAAPLELDETALEHAELATDRETYRNIQTVVVTGTPAAGVDAIVRVESRQNDDQIAARAALEGGTGRYEMIEEVTHPTSNDSIDCQLLGIGYATLRLTVSGVPRQTLTCRVRGYGFRAGQFATLDFSLLGLSGTWLIQRVQLTEQDGVRLLYDLELVQSSLQQRAYESWLKIVEAGKLVVQMPSAITANSQTFNTPGAHIWTVPAGVTVIQITAKGAGAGGAGCNTYDYVGSGVGANGGNGGASGKAISIVTVVEGQVFDITVGAGSAGQVNTLWSGTGLSVHYGLDSSAGGATYVKLGTDVKCQGDGGRGAGGGDWIYPLGGGGGPGTSGGAYWFDNYHGMPGGGVGDAVLVGGGSSTALGGQWQTGSTGVNGSDGAVEIAW